MAVRMAPITIALPDSPAIVRPSLKRRPPPLTKPLDDPFRLFPGDLFQVRGGFRPFPFHDQRCEVPVQVPPESLILETALVRPAAPGDSRWILTRRPVIDDGKVRHLFRHTFRAALRDS